MGTYSQQVTFGSIGLRWRTAFLAFLFCLTTVNCGINEKRAKRAFGPPTDFEVTELGDYEVQTSRWKHGGTAEIKVFEGEDLYKHSKYSAKPTEKDHP